MVFISAAVEGLVDEAVVKRLIAEAGAAPAQVYGKSGKAALRVRIAGYNNAAKHAPWIVLVDLDNDAPCAPDLRDDWLAAPASQLCFRVAVREVEAWLLADRERLARFLSVPASEIPVDPEGLADPKQTMVALAERSTRQDIRGDMVPRRGSGRRVGPAYTSRLIEFVAAPSGLWRPRAAAARSISLRRCLDCLGRLARSAGSRF